MGNISINERKRPLEVENHGPGGKLAQMIMAALDPGGKVRPVPNDEEPGTNDCLVIEGALNGHSHRVLIDGVSGTAKGTKERLNRLVRYKKSLSAEACFFCMAAGTPGEVLLLCLKIGLTPVEYDYERGTLRVHLGTATIVRHVAIESWNLSVFVSQKDRKGQRFDEKSAALFIQGKPIRNWLSRESRKLLQKVKEDCSLSAKYLLKKPVAFETEGRTIEAEYLEASFECRIQHRVHSLQADLADLEYNPRLRKALWSGNVPRERKELARLPGLVREDAPLLGKNTTSKPELHVYHPVPAASATGFPDLNPLIQSTDIRIRNS